MAQKAEFAVEKKHGIMNVGRSSILQPKTDFKGGETKWFDDSQLLKSKDKN